MTKEIGYFILLFGGAFLGTSAVIGIIRAVCARVIAGKAGILKVCVTWSTLIIHLAVCALFIYFGITRVNEAQKHLRTADKYEAIIDRLDDIIGDGFQQVAEKTPAESSEEIRRKISAYRELGEANKTYAIVLFIIAVSDLVSAVSAIWYITEEGVLLSNFKCPEPFNAALNGNKIEINLAAKLKNANKVITFKATPENLAVFGRFMVWEQEAGS